MSSFVLSTIIPIDAEQHKPFSSNEVIHDNLKWKLTATLFREECPFRTTHIEAYVECLPVVPGTPVDTRAQFVFNNNSKTSFPDKFDSAKPQSRPIRFRIEDLAKPSRVGYNISTVVTMWPRTPQNSRFYEEKNNSWANQTWNRPKTASMIDESINEPVCESVAQAIIQTWSRPNTISSQSINPPVKQFAVAPKPFATHLPSLNDVKKDAKSIEVSRIEALEKDVTSLKQEKKTYADRCLKLEETVQKLDGRIQATDAKVALIEKPAEKAPEALEQKYTEPHLHSQICLLTAALTLSNEQKVGLEEAIQKLDLDKKNLSQTITMLEGEMENLKISETTLSKKLEETEEGAATFKKNSKNLAEKYRDIINDQKQEISQLTEGFGDSNAKLVHQTVKLENLKLDSKREFDEMAAKFKKQVDTLKKELEEKDSKIVELTHDKDAFAREHRMAAHLFTHCDNARYRHEKKITFYAEKCRNLELKIDKLEEELKQKCLEIVELQKKCEDSIYDSYDMQKAYDEQVKKVKKMELMEEENKKTIEELRKKLEAGDAEIKKLEGKLVEAKERGDSYKMGVKYERTEVENYKKIVDVANKKLEEKDAQVNNLIYNMQVVQKDLESTVREKDADIEQLYGECNTYLEENEKLSRNVKKMEAEIERQEDEIKEIDGRMIDVMCQREDFKDNYDECHGKLVQVTDDLKKQEVEIKEKDEKIENLRHDRETYKKQYGFYYEQAVKLTDTTTQYEEKLLQQVAKIEQLEEQVRKMEQDLKRCESTHNRDSITIGSYIQESAALNHKNGELEKEIEELKKAAAATPAFDYKSFYSNYFNL